MTAVVAAKTVDDYINGARASVKETLQAARALILETVPAIEEFMKWGTPTYRLPEGEPLFYLYGGKDHVNMGFILGAQLEDPNGLLRGEGKKDSLHVHLSSPADVKKAPIKKLIRSQ